MSMGAKDTESSNSRRSFVSTASASITYMAFITPSTVNAVYGADAKIVLPDVVQGMSDRTNKQCLVESLGNRECLVYLDPDNQLYKGNDARILFQRLASSVSAMDDIPRFVESKEWNKVQSTLTGRMGNLSSTMSELVKLIEKEDVKDKCKALSVDIRNDLYGIAGAADRKLQKDALKSYGKAVKKLEKFVALVNEA